VRRRSGGELFVTKGIILFYQEKGGKRIHFPVPGGEIQLGLNVEHTKCVVEMAAWHGDRKKNQCLARGKRRY